jgi:hypothetical protein
LNYTPSLRKVAAQRLLRDAVHADGGPLIHNGSEGATLLRRDLPQTPPLPQSTSALPVSYPQIFQTRQ